MFNLSNLFQSLESDSTIDETNQFSAIPIPEYERYRLAKDNQGRPLLLISVVDTQGQKQPTPIVLEHLTVLYDQKCRVAFPDRPSEEKQFTVVHCTGKDTALHSYFLRVASAIITSLKDRPTQSDVAHTMNRLIELFRAMTEPPRKSVRGLWAELYLISCSSRPAILIDAWHTMIEDRYDFAMDNQRIEVKSFSGDTRRHHFSLEQLHPPEGVITLVGSILVARSQAGKSVTDLREKIQNRLGNHLDSLLHLDSVIALTLGSNWRGASEARFDVKLGKDSLAFYEASAIPSVSPDIPSAVSRVRFQSDLMGIQVVDLSHYRAKGRLFKAALR